MVEIKFYRTFQVSIHALLNAVETLRMARVEESANFAILAINARLDEDVRHQLKPFQDLLIYDYDVLSNLFMDHVDLAGNLEQLLQEAFAYRNDPIPLAHEIPDERVFWAEQRPGQGRAPRHTGPQTVPLKLVPRVALGRPHADRRGGELCTRLKSIKAGKGKAAKDFEAACEGALRYLFSDDLTGWRTQKTTSTRLHKYDLIARISSKNDFWNSLVSDYRARYVIFEFKNYGRKITQKEIYGTEKYLLPLAMRSMAIIISRNGVNQNAHRVMAGALRESGKLILSIDIKGICDMLHKKDHGEDTILVLSEALDEMLSELER